MTLRELSKYYKLHKRLEQNEEMLASLYIAAGLGAQEIFGTAHASGISDPVSRLVFEIEDLKKQIESLTLECALEKRKLERYICAIQDDQTRIIFRLRFIQCMTWSQVADAIGGRNTANSVKLICHRYLNPKS